MIFCLFRQKSRILRPKTHLWKFQSSKLPPPLFRKNHKRCLKKVIEKFPLKKGCQTTNPQKVISGAKNMDRYRVVSNEKPKSWLISYQMKTKCIAQGCSEYCRAVLDTCFLSNNWSKGWGDKDNDKDREYVHTSYLSREPRVYPCRFFLAGVNFYRFNAKNWHFRQILREKVAFFLQI